MRLPVRILPLGCLTLLLGGTYGCNRLIDFSLALTGQPPVSPIAQLQKPQNSTSTVYLQGQVGYRAPFLGSGAYLLSDDTGSIWVITEQSLPKTGEMILIEGQVRYASIPVDEQDLGELIIIEVKQLSAEPDSSLHPDTPPAPTLDE